jgi:UDP-N-acetylglucosamine acyltransferase
MNPSKPDIHPAAHVHPSAKIGQNSRVGPGAIIDAEVTIGNNCEIRAGAIITGHTTLGDNNQIGYHAVIGAEPQDLCWKPDAGPSFVNIGSNNTIREYVTIHRGTDPGSATVVGNGCFLMAGAHLAHNVQLGDNVIMANNALCAGHVTVADRAFISGGVVIHQHVRIGRLAMLQGNCAVGKDVPPFTIAARVNRLAGLNSVGLRRAGMPPQRRAALKKAYHILFRGNDALPAAIKKINEHPELNAIAEVRELLDFIAASKRGIIIRHLGGEDTE